MFELPIFVDLRSGVFDWMSVCHEVRVSVSLATKAPDESFALHVVCPIYSSQTQDNIFTVSITLSYNVLSMNDRLAPESHNAKADTFPILDDDRYK